MDTEWIEILHVTDSDAVVLAITDNLVLDLLPSLHGALNKHLWRGSKCLNAEVVELLVVVGETRSETSKGEGSTDNDWEADVLDAGHGLVNVAGRGRLGALLADGLHGAGKELTILGLDDGVDWSTEDLNAELGKLILELDTNLEGGLSTEGDVDGIRRLVLDDLTDEVGSDWEEVNLVGETGRGLDSGNVWVDENGVDALLLQCLDGLGSGVIELPSLSNGEATRSENKDLLWVNTWVGLAVLSSDTTWEVDWDGHLARVLKGLDDCVDENVEKVLSVPWSWSRLWVELDGEVWTASVADTLVRAVVGVYEKLLPAERKSRLVDSVTVVLGSDVALSAQEVGTWDVVSAVTELHLEGAGTSGSGEELVTQADTEDWSAVLLHSRLDVVDGLGHHGWVTWTVGDEKAIVVLAGKLWEVVVPWADKNLNTTAN